MGECGLVAAFNKIFFSHKKLVSGCNKTHYDAPSGIERAQNTKTHGTSHSSAQISSRLTNFQSFLTKLLYLEKTCNLQRVLSWRNSLPNLGILGICWKAYFWSSKTFYFWSSQFLKCPQPQSFPVKNDPVFPDPQVFFFVDVSLQGISHVIWILGQKDRQQLLVRFPDSIFKATRALRSWCQDSGSFLNGHCPIFNQIIVIERL